MSQKEYTSETDYGQDLLSRISIKYYPKGLFYRRNVGVGTPIGRNYIMRFGLKGQADLGGILNSFAVEIETKFKNGKQTKEQKNWQAAVERSGGTYILARPENEANTFAILDSLNDR